MFKISFGPTIQGKSLRKPELFIITPLIKALTNLMKNKNSRGHHTKRLETDQCLQEIDIRIETFVKIDQVSSYYLATNSETANSEF